MKKHFTSLSFQNSSLKKEKQKEKEGKPNSVRAEPEIRCDSALCLPSIPRNHFFEWTWSGELLWMFPSLWGWKLRWKLCRLTLDCWLIEITDGKQWKHKINYWVASSNLWTENIDNKKYFQEWAENLKELCEKYIDVEF